MDDKESPIDVASPMSLSSSCEPLNRMVSPTLTAGASTDKEKLSCSDEEARQGLDGHPSSESPAPTFLTGIKLVAVIASLLLSIFLIVLDRTIVATALPVVASHFKSLEQGAWIATSYFLTQVGFIPAFGQVMTVTRIKWTFLFSTFIFAFGSTLCGAAWNFHTLIIGRAIAGIGGSGATVSILVITAQVTTLQQRAVVISSFSIAMALGNVLGPLMGGALTDHVSWRWCFYINLPLSAAAGGVILVCLEDRPTTRTTAEGNAIQSQPVWKRIVLLDWLGSMLYLAMTICLLLALEWGGTSLAWSSPKIIVLLCLTALFLALFLVWEHRMGLKAVIPLTLFTKTTVISANIHTFIIMMMTMIAIYYLPIYFQVARSHSPTQAAVDVLGYMISVIVGSTASGYFAARTGRIRPLMTTGPLIASLVSGLIFWVLMHSEHPRTNAAMIVLQVALALGIGICMQQGIVFVQAEYRNEPRMIPQATAMASAIQLFGAVIGIAIAGTVLNNRLKVTIPRYAPDLPSDITRDVVQSATAILKLDTLWKSAVQRAYAEALARVFIIGAPSGILASLASLMMANIDLKEKS